MPIIQGGISLFHVAVVTGCKFAFEKAERGLAVGPGVALGARGDIEPWLLNLLLDWWKRW